MAEIVGSICSQRVAQLLRVRHSNKDGVYLVGGQAQVNIVVHPSAALQMMRHNMDPDHPAGAQVLSVALSGGVA